MHDVIDLQVWIRSLEWCIFGSYYLLNRTVALSRWICLMYFSSFYIQPGADYYTYRSGKSECVAPMFDQAYQEICYWTWVSLLDTLSTFWLVINAIRYKSLSYTQFYTYTYLQVSARYDVFPIQPIVSLLHMWWFALQCHHSSLYTRHYLYQQVESFPYGW